jgi:phosphomannomutase
VAVAAVADHAAGVQRHSDGREEPLETPPTDLVGLTLADGSRLQVRPSGTEPLLKFYVEVVEPVAADEAVAAARRRAAQRLDDLSDAFLAVAGV